MTFPFARAKPFPGVDRFLVKSYLGISYHRFLHLAGIMLLAYVIPVSESLAFLLVLGAWVLFLLFFSATMFWLVLKGLFF